MNIRFEFGFEEVHKLEQLRSAGVKTIDVRDEAKGVVGWIILETGELFLNTIPLKWHNGQSLEIVWPNE